MKTLDPAYHVDGDFMGFVCSPLHVGRSFTLKFPNVNWNNISKNRSHIRTKTGIIRSTASRKWMYDAEVLLRNAYHLQEWHFEEGKKIWVTIRIIKANPQADAVNCVDTVMDVIKRAIKIDDCWFSIHRLDWELGQETSIEIMIWQE